MEQRVHELESDLEAEQHRHSETVKAMRRQERRMKELAVQLDDDRHSQDKLHEIIEKLHAKLKSYKRHAEETVSVITFLATRVVELVVIVEVMLTANEHSPTHTGLMLDVS